MSKYLKIIETHDTGKTKVFTINSAMDGTALGRISWYPTWRRYVLASCAGVVWDASCLGEVVAFLEKLMLDRDPAYQKLCKEAAAGMVADMYGETD